jgi:LPXTG-motif cell wall-anchored protein
LLTAANYSVLAGATVTNTGPSVLNNSAGLSPGSSIVGFPPGIVLPPGTVDATSPAAAQAQLDLNAAYDNAAGRPLNATVTNDLTGLTLVGGVYAGPSKSPLSLSGTLVLDGAGDPNSVFIFQTDSTLITGSASTVSLINGAQECNVFWQVGSSATLGTGSVFAGNILALADISVTTGVTIHGRALARSAGAVTLDTDVFTSPTCDLTTPVVTTTTTPATTASAVATTAPGATTPPVGTTPPGGTIPRTGSQAERTLLLAGVALTLGLAATGLARRKTVTRSDR